MKSETKREGMTKKEITDALNWRYATKAYNKNRKITAEDWATLEESLILAPSSFGLQPYKFIVVTDDAVREKLRAAAWNQPQVTDASHLVVFAYKNTLTDADIDHYFARIAEVRGVSRESLSDYEGMVSGSVKGAVAGGVAGQWNSRQAYIALGFLLQTAALLGIDATPMEGFDVAQFNDILGLTDYSSVVIAAVGYRDAESDWLSSLPKVRFPAEELIDRR
jgi:nitroreductase